MKEEKRVPKRRFKEFIGDDAWEQRKLENVLVNLQNNTLSRADLSDNQGVAKNIHYGDILIKFGEVLDLTKAILPMILEKKIVDKYKASYLRNGDVIVADTAEDETVGKCSEIAGLGNETVISGLHTIPYRPILEFATGYLGYYMNSGTYHNQLFPLMQGIKVTSISRTAMKNTLILYPQRLEEQFKISSFFQRIDNLITLHQRKYDKLKSLKSAYLSEMFPQEGEKVPKRRFPGFTDAWEQRKLGDVVDFLDERRKPLEAGERESGVYQYYGATGIIDYVKDYIFNDELILLSEDGANIIDRNYRVCFLASGKYWVNNHAHIMKARSEYCNGFICEALERLDYTTYNTGTAQPKLNQKTCCNIMLLVPSYAEQLKIFSMLASFDHLITLHQRKLEKLKNLKAAYLQEMFV